MSKFWEKVFFLCTWVLQGPSFLPPHAYVKMHLEHHAHSDAAGDPHSPAHFWDHRRLRDIPMAAVKMMWSTKIIFSEITSGVHAIAHMYRKRKFPEWNAVEMMASSKTGRLLCVALYVLFYSFFVTVWWQWLLVGIIIINAPIQGFVVNWCGHMWGSRNYDLPDNSKNTPFAPFMLGELYQNNHHQNEHNPNFARTPYEFDPAYFILRILKKIHIIRFT